MKSLFEDSNQQVNADGDPDLGFDGVGRYSVKSFDSQMLLDPSKEEFHLPVLFVNVGDGYGGNGKDIGEITGKSSDSVIALVFFNEFVKLIPWNMLQYLRKDRFPDIHRQPSLSSWRGRYRSECVM